MLKIIEIKETLEDSKFVDNIYNIQRINKEIINILFNLFENIFNDNNFNIILIFNKIIASSSLSNPYNVFNIFVIPISPN